MIKLIEILTDLDFQKFLKTNEDVLKEYTFGIEFEYKPELSDDTNEEIEKKLLRAIQREDKEIVEDYENWLRSDELPDQIKNEIGSIDDFIKSGDHLTVYIDSNWAWYTNDFVDYIMNNHLYEKYGYSTDDENDIINSIHSVSNYLKEELKQEVKVNIEDAKTAVNYSTHWFVHPDEDNIEIASKILKLDDYDNLVIPLIEWIYKNNPNQSSMTSGLHVHIGVPEGYDVYNALYSIFLMDEKSLPKSPRSKRYVQPKNELFKKIIDLLNLKKKSILNIPITKTEFKNAVNNEIEKYYGVNIKPALTDKTNKTIEFRYLGITAIEELKEWIKYYIAIIHTSYNNVPNQFVYSINNNDLIVTNLENNIKFELKK